MRVKFKLRKKKNMRKEESSKRQNSTENTPLLLINPTCSLEDHISDVEKDLTKARNLLYKSHFAAKFTEIAWQFCLIIWFTALTGYNSLILVSTYGLFCGLVVCSAGPSIGRFVDSKKYSRLEIAQVFIWVQNLSVVGATLCCYILFQMVSQENINSPSKHVKDFVPPFNLISVGLLVATHIFGAIAKLTDTGITVAMERDWIVVMSKFSASDIDDNDEYYSPVEGDSMGSESSEFYSIGSISVGNADVDKAIIRGLKEKTWLSQTNIIMKQIDLLCKVAGPAAAGFYLAAFDNNGPNISLDIQHWNNLSYAAIIIGLLNLISLYVEFACTKDIYKLIPLLSNRRSSEHNDPVMKIDDSVEVEFFPKRNIGCGILVLPASLSLYLEQTVAPGGLALALLYMNVLSFGGLMTAYLVWLGIDYNTIGVMRGVSAVIGLGGTVAFTISVRKGLAFTGMWSILFQFGWLGLCYLSIYIKSLSLSMWLLMIGVCFSRIGLWAFDLTITQYMQESIPEHIRGRIGGVQNSLNGFFDLCTFALGLVLSDPRHFPILVAIGYFSVGTSLTLYYFGVYRKRNLS